MLDYTVPLSIILAVIIMGVVGYVMERGLIRHFYKRPHADQILVTLVLPSSCGEMIRHYFGANPIPQSAPKAVSGSANIGEWVGLGPNVIYPWWRLVYFHILSLHHFCRVCIPADLQRSGWSFGQGCRTGKLWDCWVSTSSKKFTIVFALAAIVAGVAGAMYTPILPPDYNHGAWIS